MGIPEKNDPMAKLTAKIKKCKPEIQNFIAVLKAENLELQKQVAKLQAQNITLNNRFKTLKEEQSNPILQVVDFSTVKPHKKQ